MASKVRLVAACGRGAAFIALRAAREAQGQDKDLVTLWLSEGDPLFSFRVGQGTRRVDSCLCGAVSSPYTHSCAEAMARGVRFVPAWGGEDDGEAYL